MLALLYSVLYPTLPSYDANVLCYFMLLRSDNVFSPSLHYLSMPLHHLPTSLLYAASRSSSVVGKVVPQIVWCYAMRGTDLRRAVVCP